MQNWNPWSKEAESIIMKFKDFKSQLSIFQHRIKIIKQTENIQVAMHVQVDKFTNGFLTLAWPKSTTLLLNMAAYHSTKSKVTLTE